jgi:hypothetical protein
MYFLLGNLYINFQLLWEPTSKLIASYARGMNITEFWEVFGEKLHLTAQQIKGFNQETVSLISLNCEYLYTCILTSLPVVIRTCCCRNFMHVQFLLAHVVQPGPAIKKIAPFCIQLVTLKVYCNIYSVTSISRIQFTYMCQICMCCSLESCFR